MNDYAVDEYAFMIPQQFAPWDPETDSQNQNGGAYIAVKVQVSTSAGVRVFPKENDDYAWVAIPIIGSDVLDESGYARADAYQWKGDYAYYYTLDFTNGAGYIEPNIGNLQSGTPVLGDGAVVKMTMTLGQMQEGVEDLVVNPNMLGKWTAQTFKLTQTYYKMLVDENDDPIYNDEGNRQCALDKDGNRIVLWSKTTELEGADVIGPQIDNFANITILDGTNMIIKDKNGNEGEIEYFVNDENYILIECYRYSGEFGSLDAGHYSPSPKISSIVRATPTSDGQAKIIVEDTDWGYSDPENGVYEPYIWEDEMIITYDIEYLAKDSE